MSDKKCEKNSGSGKHEKSNGGHGHGHGHGIKSSKEDGNGKASKNENNAKVKKPIQDDKVTAQAKKNLNASIAEANALIKTAAADVKIANGKEGFAKEISTKTGDAVKSIEEAAG